MRRLKLPLLFILLLVFSFTLSRFPIRADNPIQVANQAIESRYGHLVTFLIHTTRAKAINFQPDREIRVGLFPSHTAYLSFYATGTHSVEEWLGGQTYGTLAVLWYNPQIGNYTYSFQIGIPHEIAHAFLFARL